LENGVKKIFLVFFTFLFLGTPVFGSDQKTEDEFRDEFLKWVVDFKKTAKEQYGINETLLEKAFSEVEYKPKIIKLDRNQPEFVKTFWGYYDNAVHPLRVRRGKAKMKENEKLLKRVEKKYGVPANIIVAFWGIETDYGRNMGNSSIVEVLSTLSFDHRRSKFFTEELINVFKILQSGKMPLEDMKGSWAGAFGNFQFLPSTYLNYSVDCDGDGKADLRNSLADAFCSAANYLSKIGWNENYRWGRPVKFDRNNQKIWAEVNSKEWKDISYFSNLGVTRTNGSRLPRTNINAKLIAPMGVDGPIFLIYDNFKRIMRWNNSTNYALSVGLLSDAITDNKIGKIEKTEN